MAALDFPASPSVGQLYPASPVAGVPTYRWDGEKWTTTGGAIGSTGAYTGSPLVDGTASPGSSTQWARGDHVHPIYTDPAIATKAPLASPAFTGNPIAPTPPIGDSDTSIATTDFVRNSVALPNGVDLNTVDVPGHYYTNDGTATNGPNANYFYLIVFRYTSNATVGQIAMALNGPPTLYFRNKQTTWTAWKTVTDSSMIGTYVDYYTAAAKLINASDIWASGTFVSLPDGATVTPDFSGGINFQWALGAAGRTLANPTNAKIGQSGMIYINAGASGTITTWGSAWKFANGGVKPTLTISGADCLCYTVRTTGLIVCSMLNDVK